MNTTLKDGPCDMFVEDLLSLLTPDSNGYLSKSSTTWSQVRHFDKRVDAIYDRYAQEMDPEKRKEIATELQNFMIDNMYWNAVSGSPFYQVAQPWMKGYTYNGEFEVHYETVWLDK
jgi:ABC-type transport system substrate-binding protein